MELGYWISRYLLAAGVLGAILVGVEYSKGAPTRGDIVSSVIWALVAAAIFVGSKYYKFRKGQACAVCKDSEK